jgi:hypothetical protein
MNDIKKMNKYKHEHDKVTINHRERERDRETPNLPLAVHSMQDASSEEKGNVPGDGIFFLIHNV